MKRIKDIIYLLTKYEKKLTFIVLILVIFMAFFEMLGVASIMPFISMASDTSLIEKNYYYNFFFNYLNFDSKLSFLFFVGLLVFFVFLFSTLFRAFTTAIIINYSRFREYSISNRFMKIYLNQDYDFYLTKNSSDIIKMISHEVNQVVNGSLMPLIDIITQSFVVLAIFGLLLYVNPGITIYGGSSIAIVYFIIFFLVRRRLFTLSEQKKDSNQVRYRVLSEAFKGIKIIKLLGIENYFLKIFKNAAYYQSLSHSRAYILARIPKFFVEILAYGGILLLILILIRSSGEFQKIIPTLALFAMAGYKLIPGLQSIYTNLVSIKFTASTLNQLSDELRYIEKLNKKINFRKIITFKKEIIFNNVNYKYPSSDNMVIKDINLIIKKNQFIGLVGETGSGKTTIIDLLTGLLKPTSGNIIIDQKTILQDENLASWKTSIGYVPQDTFLIDDTIESNIALGVKQNEIDHKMILKASKMAQIKNFVESLPLKHQTKIGEQGARLSGGQRQRIGIARALYKKPKLLIFDEATSSLDNLVEKDVIEAIKNISKNLTTIILAHRLTTVKSCDIIFFIDSGKIIDSGNFFSLSKRNKKFKKMVENANLQHD